jgi:hypothetical protein
VPAVKSYTCWEIWEGCILAEEKLNQRR